MPGFLQDIERPHIVRAYGKAWGTVAVHAAAGQIFQQDFCVNDVFTEFIAIKLGHALMGIAVARQLMPIFNNPPHHCRVTFGDPAQGKKCGPGLPRIKQA